MWSPWIVKARLASLELPCGSLQILCPLQLRIDAVERYQLVSCALFHDVHTFYDCNAVRASHSGEAVGDDNAGLAGAEDIQAVLDLLFSDTVEG